MQMFDAVALGNVRVTGDGYLVTDAHIARTGIQIYAGREIGRPDLKEVRVYRDAAEVFSKAAMASFTHRPVTNDHPPENVSSKNWKSYSVGITGDEVARDGERLRVPMTVMDQEAIDAINAGKRELSCGYSCELEFVDGVTAGGERYDAIQKNIRGNHLAIVDAGRAGSMCRIGDDDHNRNPHMTMRTIVVDGISIETTDQGAQALEKLQRQLSDKNKELTDATAAHAAAIGAKDRELATRDAQIEDLKKKQLSDAELDKLVTTRADVVAKAKRISDADYSGKSIADIRRMAVAKKLGEAVVKDKSDDYVEARFDHLAGTTATNDAVRSAVMADDVSANDIAAQAAKAKNDRAAALRDAWQAPAGGNA